MDLRSNYRILVARDDGCHLIIIFDPFKEQKSINFCLAAITCSHDAR